MITSVTSGVVRISFDSKKQIVCQKLTEKIISLGLSKNKTTFNFHSFHTFSCDQLFIIIGKGKHLLIIRQFCFLFYSGHLTSWDQFFDGDVFFSLFFYCSYLLIGHRFKHLKVCSCSLKSGSGNKPTIIFSPTNLYG